MLELVEVQPLPIDKDDILYLKAFCKKHFKDHEFSFGSDGYISLIKETWANPESFSMYWYEFVVRVIPDKLASYYRKWFYESCIIKKFNNTLVQHPIAWLRVHISIT